MSPDRRRFDSLAPWYPTGQLSPEDRRFVDAYAANDPDARAALAWHKDLAGVVAARAERRAAQVPEMVGWRGLEARLAADRATRAAIASSSIESSRTPTKPGLRERALAALEAILGSLTARPLQAIAATLIVAQAITIGVLMQPSRDDTEYAATRGADRTTALPTTVLQVRFKTGTTEAELRELLYRAEARILDGPDQLGDYVIAPRRGPLDALAKTLAADPHVQNVGTLKDWHPEAD